ncbi:MAG: peptidylprolyl isomerase [Chitinispirillaceae bacterium]
MKIWQTAAVMVTALAAMSFASQEKLDGIAAVVGDEIILQSELEAYALMRLESMGMKPESVDMKEVNKNFLKELIDNKVLLVHAKEDSTISVTREEVENALNDHIATLLQQNNVTLEQLDQELRTRQGKSLSQFKSEAREAIREQLYKQKVQQAYFYSTRVNRRDVEKFYEDYSDSLPNVGESVNLSKLSFKIAPSSSVKQAAYDKIRSIRKQLEEGASFEELAKKHSESPEGADGGDVGFISKGSISLQAFEKQAFALAQGQVSEPFETRLGYHIIEVLEKQDSKVRVRQILIGVKPEEKQLGIINTRLDSLRESIKDKEEFGKVAEKLSADGSTRDKGGSMGWISLLDLSAPVREAVKDLEEGQISKSVKEGDMISIYRVNERSKDRKLTLENDYGIIAQKAKEILAQKKLVDEIAKWREEIFIDIRI